MAQDTNGRVNELFRLPALTFTVGLVFAAGVLGSTAAYMYASEPYRTGLLFAAAACAASGQLCAALYTARLLTHTAKSQAENFALLAKASEIAHEKGLAELAMRFAERWNDASMFHTRQQCMEIIENRTDPDGIRKTLKENPQKQTNATNVLNFLEELAVAIRTSRCDEATSKRLFCGLVVNIWHATEPWVRERRSERGRPQIWAELEWLYGHWR